MQVNLIGMSLAATAALAALIGIEDASRSLTFGSRVSGILAIAASVLMLAGIRGLKRFYGPAPSAVGGSVALVASIAAFLFASFLTLFQWQQWGDGDTTWHMWVWVVLAIANTVGIVRLVRAGAQLPYPRQVAIAVVVSTVLALANFGYTALYLPSAQHQNVSLWVQIDDAAVTPDGKVASVPVEVNIKNEGKVEVYILVAEYSVVGRSADVVSDPQEDWVRRSVTSDQPADRNTEPRSYDLLQVSDQLAGIGQSLPPGASIHTTVTVNVPTPTPYESLGISAQVIGLRADRATIPATFGSSRNLSWPGDGNIPAWVTRDQVDTIEFHAPITQASELLRLTRDPATVHLWWVLAQPTASKPIGPHLEATIVRQESEVYDPPTNSDYDVFAKRYGYFFDYQTTPYFRSVWDLKIPRA